MLVSKMSYCLTLASKVCPAGRSELPSPIPKSQPNYFHWLTENSRELPGNPVSAVADTLLLSILTRIKEKQNINKSSFLKIVTSFEYC